MIPVMMSHTIVMINRHFCQQRWIRAVFLLDIMISSILKTKMAQITFIRITFMTNRSSLVPWMFYQIYPLNKPHQTNLMIIKFKKASILHIKRNRSSKSQINWKSWNRTMLKFRNKTVAMQSSKPRKHNKWRLFYIRLAINKMETIK